VQEQIVIIRHRPLKPELWLRINDLSPREFLL